MVATLLISIFTSLAVSQGWISPQQKIVLDQELINQISRDLNLTFDQVETALSLQVGSTIYGLQQPYSYVLSHPLGDTSLTAIQNGTTGAFEAWSTDTNTMFNAAINWTWGNNGGSILARYGTYQVAGSIRIASNVFLFFEAGSTLTNSSAAFSGNALFQCAYNSATAEYPHNFGLAGLGGYFTLDGNYKVPTIYFARANGAHFENIISYRSSNDGWDINPDDTGGYSTGEPNTVYNLKILGYSAAFPCFGLLIQGCANSIFDRIYVDSLNAYTTREGITVATSRNLTMSNIVSINNTRNGLYFDYGSAFITVNNLLTIHNGYSGWDGLKLRTANSITVSSWTSINDYDGFKFNSPYTDEGTYPYNNNVCENNYISGSIWNFSNVGGYIDVDSNNSVFQNNRIDLLIDGNGKGSYGFVIYDDGGRNASITSNVINLQIFNVTKEGMIISNGTGTVISGNKFNLVINGTTNAQYGNGLEFQSPAAACYNNTFDLVISNCANKSLISPPANNVWTETSMLAGKPFASRYVNSTAADGKTMSVVSASSEVLPAAVITSVFVTSANATAIIVGCNVTTSNQITLTCKNVSGTAQTGQKVYVYIRYDP